MGGRDVLPARDYRKCYRVRGVCLVRLQQKSEVTGSRLGSMDLTNMVCNCTQQNTLHHSLLRARRHRLDPFTMY